MKQLTQSFLESEPFYWHDNIVQETKQLTDKVLSDLGLVYPKMTGDWLDQCKIEAHIFDTLNYTDGSPNTYSLIDKHPMWALTWSHDPSVSTYHPHFHDDDILRLTRADRFAKGIPKSASFMDCEIFSIGFYKLDDIILIKALKMNGHLRRFYNNSKHLPITSWFLDRFMEMTLGHTLVSLEAESHRRYCRENKLTMVPDYGFDKRMFKRAGFTLLPTKEVLATYWDDMIVNYDLKAWVKCT
jgi:hypothetical protein